VLISSDASLLHFSASAVRPQGRSAGGMAGMKLASDARIIFFGAVRIPNDAEPDPGGAVVVTVAGSLGQLNGTQASSIKVSEFSLFPAKGRATGGVRCHRLVKGEDALIMAWVGPEPARAETTTGAALELPTDRRARDASGDRLVKPIAALGGSA
jgi:DNA gyrase subunit A